MGGAVLHPQFYFYPDITDVDLVVEAGRGISKPQLTRYAGWLVGLASSSSPVLSSERRDVMRDGLNPGVFPPSSLSARRGVGHQLSC